MTDRSDLRALTDDALAALTNRGLVKRAAKDPAPTLETAPDATVTGRFPDGVVATLPAGGLAAARCSCAAGGTCRHVVGTVLAYRAAPDEPAGEPAGGSAPATAPGPAATPGAITDEELAAAFGARTVAAARKRWRAGYAARVVRGGSGPDAVPMVHLPSCTVRFLVPGDLGYAHTDAVGPQRGEMVTLAVWAFRVADDRAPDQADLDLEVGPVTAAPAAAPTVPGPDPLRLATDLTDAVLRDGVRSSAGPSAGRVARVRATLAAAHLTWPLAAVDDLAGQLRHYADGHADHDPRTVAALLAEVAARRRAVTADPGRRTRVLGVEERAETVLSRVRLVGLGARITGRSLLADGGPEQPDVAELTADVLLADAATGVVLVLRQRWREPVAALPTGAALARRRLGGARLGDLATGSVVTESARRSAGRLLRLTADRVARTSVTRPLERWSAVPDALVVGDYAAAEAALGRLPPKLVRPRVAAESVRVLTIGEVVRVGYRPGAQVVEAVVADPAGTRATVVAPFRGTSPGGLDLLTAALSGRHGRPLMISAVVRRGHGGLRLDPLAVLTTDDVLVPDLAPGDGAATLAAAEPAEPDALTSALDAGLDLLADLAHTGLDRLPGSHPARVGRVAAELRAVGLTGCAAAVDVLATTPVGTRAWTDAQIRLLVATEVR